ncbi:MAG: class I SAM-dependent methyltransferase [Bacillota bacterium]
MQKKRFTEVIEGVDKELDLSSFETIIDIGCGTGALCSVLNDKGLSVTGIDPANKMLEIARNKQENNDISFIQADVLEGLPFDNNSFDVAIASYVAHGLEVEERKLMYAEMSRVTKQWVVIYDYNDKRSLLITIIEWLEGGDYFHFIKNAEPEMRDCVLEMKNCFSKVEVVNVDTSAAWYICKPFV